MSRIGDQLQTKTNQLQNQVDKEFKETRLLLESPKDEYQDIREKLGFNQIEKENKEKLGKLIQEKSFLKQAGKDAVIDNDLYETLLHNNYTISTLSTYKGYVTNEFLKIISDYLKANEGFNLASGANKDQLLVIHPLTMDYKEDAKNTEELIVVERISDVRVNGDKVAYRVIGKTGTSNVLKNKINALFFNHTRQINSLANTIIITAVCLLFWIITKIAISFSTSDTLREVIFKNYQAGLIIFLLGFVILVGKFFFVPIVYKQSSRSDETLMTGNVFNDEGYDRIAPESSYKLLFLKSVRVLVNQEVVGHFKFLDTKLVKVIKLYNILNKAILLGLFVLFFYLIQWLPMSLYLSNKGVQVFTSKDAKVKYTPSTWFTFNKEKVFK